MLAAVAFAARFACVAGIAWLADESTIAMVFLALGISTIVFPAIGLLFALSWNMKVAGMARGDFFVHWEYDNTTWRKLLKKRDRKKQKLTLWCISVVFAGACAAGAVAGVVKQVGDAGNVIKPWFHIAVPIAASLAFAAIFAGMYHWLMNHHDARRKAAPGRAIIGYEGLYLPGEFWPWSSFGQGLSKVSYERSKRLLVFTFTNRTQHGVNYQDVNVAVPKGEEQTAADVVAILES